jgi:hypothetical protein
MKLKLFKLLPLVLFSLAASGYSETTPGEQPSGYDQGQSVQANQMMSGYNSPARIEVEGAWDFYLTGSLIYWQAEMDGLSLGSYSYPNATKPGEMLNTEFSFKPGFKVGLGMNSGFDTWTFYGEYIWIRDAMHTSHSIPLTGVTTNSGFWNETPSGFTNAKSEWTHHNNIADLIMGRSYYVGTHLTLMPFIGARGYWMDQDFGVTYTVSPTSTLHTYGDIDSWAVGARTGVQTSWLLGKDFRIIGNVAGSLAYQKFKSSLIAYGSNWATINANIRDHHAQITPNIEGAFGLGWGSYFSDREWHFDFAALYEFHYFWNQNALRTMVQELNSLPSGTSGDLMYQGLTLTARLDF